ncbi:MAG: hypothetical protein ABFS23_10835, partial [Pseudomonadota bacterium]
MEALIKSDFVIPADAGIQKNQTPRSLSGLGLIYCGKALLARFPDPFRQIATAILLKRSKNLSQNGFPSLRSPKSDRLLDSGLRR